MFLFMTIADQVLNRIRIAVKSVLKYPTLKMSGRADNVLAFEEHTDLKPFFLNLATSLNCFFEIQFVRPADKSRMLISNPEQQEPPLVFIVELHEGKYRNVFQAKTCEITSHRRYLKRKRSHSPSPPPPTLTPETTSREKTPAYLVVPSPPKLTRSTSPVLDASSPVQVLSPPPQPVVPRSPPREKNSANLQPELKKNLEKGRKPAGKTSLKTLNGSQMKCTPTPLQQQRAHTLPRFNFPAQ